MCHKGFQQGILRAETAGAAGAHGAQSQQFHTTMRDAQVIGNIVDLGVELEPASDRPGLCAGPLIDQVLHLGNRLEVRIELRGQAERQSEVASRIRINRDDVLSALLIDV